MKNEDKSKKIDFMYMYEKIERYRKVANKRELTDEELSPLADELEFMETTYIPNLWKDTYAYDYFKTYNADLLMTHEEWMKELRAKKYKELISWLENEDLDLTAYGKSLEEARKEAESKEINM